MLHAPDSLDLLEPLISGTVEDPPWSGFIERLRARLRAGYASLVFRPSPQGSPQSRLIHLFSGEQWPPIVNQLYRERLDGSDPLPYHELEEGRVYALSE